MGNNLLDTSMCLVEERNFLVLSFSNLQIKVLKVIVTIERFNSQQIHTFHDNFSECHVGILNWTFGYLLAICGYIYIKKVDGQTLK